MGTIKAVDFERSRLGRGMKTAALVLVLTAGALTADHLFFVAPNAQPTAMRAEARAVTPTAVATDGFALPDHLRHPSAADSDAPAPSF